MLKSLTLAILATLAFAAEEAKEAKPNPAIEKAIAPALAEASKGYDVYKDILAKASDKAVKELEKLKAEAMKKGDLPLAVAIDTQIKGIKEGSLGDRVVEKTKAKGDLPGDEKANKGGMDIADKFLGTWTFQNGIQIMTAIVTPSTLKNSDGNSAVYSVHEGMIMLKWASGATHFYKYDKKQDVFLGDNEGKRQVYTRVKK